MAAEGGGRRSQGKSPREGSRGPASTGLWGRVPETPQKASWTMVSLWRWGAREGPMGKGYGQTVRQASVPCPKMGCTPTDPYIWALSLEVASASCSGLEGLPHHAHAAPGGGGACLHFILGEKNPASSCSDSPNPPPPPSQSA